MTSKKNRNDDVVLDEKINGTLDTLELCCKDLDNEENRTKALSCLEYLRTEVRKSTEAMSSVPLPLKIMRPYFDRIKLFYEACENLTNPDAVLARRELADLLSVLSTTLPTVAPTLTETGLIKDTVDRVLELRASGKSEKTGDDDIALSLTEAHTKLLIEKEKEGFKVVDRLSIRYRLEGSASKDLLSYGHEYIRSLYVDLLGEFLSRYVEEEQEEDHVDESDKGDEEPISELGGIGRYETNAEVVAELLAMGRVIADSLFSSGSFIDATDLLLELRLIKELPSMINQYTAEAVSPLRVSEYLSHTAMYERTHKLQVEIFEVAIELLIQAKLFADGFKLLTVQFSAGVIDRTTFKTKLFEIMEATTKIEEPVGRMHRLQVVFHLVHANLHRILTEDEIENIISMPDGICEDIDDDDREQFLTAISYGMTSKHFKKLYQELDLEEPKHPDDVYKTYLDNYSSTENLDSAWKNLASSYVSGFVHAGYGHDTLVNPIKSPTSPSTTGGDEGSDKLWLYKNKDKGGIAAAAAIMGALYLWNIEEGLDNVDPYFSSNSNAVKAGAYLGWGLVCASSNSEFDPLLQQAAEVLCDETSNDESGDGKTEEEEKPSVEETSATVDPFVKTSALMGLALAYCGSSKQELHEVLEPIAINTDPDNLQHAYVAGLTLGLSSCGSADENVAAVLSQTVLDLFLRDMSPLDRDYDSIFLALGLALNYLGTGAQSETIRDFLGTMDNKCAFRRGALILLEACAYAGTADISLVQRFLRVISDGADVDREESDDAEEENQTDGTHNKGKNKEEEKDKKKKTKIINQDIDRRLAVLGIALVTLGDPLGQEMLLKYAESLIQFGDLQVIRSIPIALAIGFASNPQNMVMDLLSKMAHDSDPETALSAIISLSIVAAGTNNARAAKMFRQLALFYQKSTNALFLVRIGQGTVHLGKGLMTLSPLIYSGEVIRKPTLAHLLVIAMLTLNTQKHLLEGFRHLYLWHIVAAANPRMLMVLDGESLEPEPVSLRVGQRVNTVGVPGNPRGVTGFQTHTSPVVLSQGEQAEMDQPDRTGGRDLNEEVSEVPKVEAFTSSLEGIVLVRKNQTTQ